MSVVRPNPKEVEAKRGPDEQKPDTRRIIPDEKACNFNVQYLCGRNRRKSGGHKRESTITYPRRSVSRRKAGIVERWFDQGTEVSRGHSKTLDPSEGPNVRM